MEKPAAMSPISSGDGTLTAMMILLPWRYSIGFTTLRNLLRYVHASLVHRRRCTYGAHNRHLQPRRWLSASPAARPRQKPQPVVSPTLPEPQSSSRTRFELVNPFREKNRSNSRCCGAAPEKTAT